MVLAFGIETSGNEVGDNLLVVGTRLKKVVIGVDVVAFAFDFSQKIAQGRVIFFGDQVGLCNHGGFVLKIDKPMRPLEVEFDFLRIEEVEHCDVMLPESKVLQGISKFLGVSEEV